MTTNAEGVGNIVAQHYDNLPEKGREQRKDSRIFFMRCFNNWIKSTLIQEYIEKIRDRNPDGHRVKVLDFGKNILNNKTKYFWLRMSHEIKMSAPRPRSWTIESSR